jgi:hypothetical protein
MRDSEKPFEHAFAAEKDMFSRPFSEPVFSTTVAFDALNPPTASFLAEDLALCQGSLAMQTQDTQRLGFCEVSVMRYEKLWIPYAVTLVVLCHSLDQNLTEPSWASFPLRNLFEVFQNTAVFWRNREA